MIGDAGSHKRKHFAQDSDDLAGNGRSIYKNRKTDSDGSLDLVPGINQAIARSNSALLADFVAQRTKRFASDLSLVELEDQHIPGTCSMYLSASYCFPCQWELITGQRKPFAIRANGSRVAI